MCMKLMTKVIIKFCELFLFVIAIILLIQKRWLLLGVWLIVMAVLALLFARVLGHFTLNRRYFVSLGQFFDDTTEKTLPQYKTALPYCERGTAWKCHTEDGADLEATYVPGQGHDWVILCHGYAADDPFAMGAYGMPYFEKGWHVLMPQARSHGNSSGHIMGMGWKERLDLLDWIGKIKKQDSEARIVLHGVSMGGATVLNAAGENPEGVAAVIADCAYTSVWDEFAYQADDIFGLHPFPYLYLADWMNRKKLGASFKEASPEKQAAKTRIPVLFIHGEKDTFVPVWMGEKNYAACSSPKEFILEKGAYHANSVYTDPGYGRKVFEFLQKYAKFQ